MECTVIRDGGGGGSGGGAATDTTSLQPPVLPLSPQVRPSVYGSVFRTPPSFLQPLLNAVVAVSTGRLSSLPAAAVAWLLRALLSLGHMPPTAWIQEAYDSLAAGARELHPSQAANAYLAIAGLAIVSRTARTGGGNSRADDAKDAAELAVSASPPPPPPPSALLTGLYEALARPGPFGVMDPRVALACLEAAAAVESAVTALAEALIRRAAGIQPSAAAAPLLDETTGRMGAVPEADATAAAAAAAVAPTGGAHLAAASAAAATPTATTVVSPALVVAAARALVAAARLENPPRPTAVLDLASSAPLPPPIVAALISGVEGHLPYLDAVQISYCVTVVQRLAAMQSSAGSAAADLVLRFARGPAAAELARKLPTLPPARLAAAVAALPPPLRQPPPAEVAAAAHEALRRTLAAADSDDLAEVLRQLSAADALPYYGWQGALAAATSQRLRDAAALISSQELCNTLFVLAALNYRPGFSWTAAAAAALQPRLLSLTAPQLTNALWTLAKFGYRPEPSWSTPAVQALQLQLPALRPHQLSYGLGSLQRMGCTVSAAVLDEMLTVAAADQLRQYPPGDLVLLLMTVARLRHVPSYSFTEAVTERLRPHLTASPAMTAAASAGLVEPLAAAAGNSAVVAAAPPPPPLTCQELASVGYALAKLHCRPEADWMSAFMDCCLAVMYDFTTDLLASLMWALGELGQVPSPAWMGAFLAASRPRLGEFAAQDLVSVLSSLAALRSPPPADWLSEALTVLGARVGELDGEGVTALLKALVDLDARVSNPDWYDALCDQVASFLPLLSAQGLVDLVASLGTLGHTPRPEWLERCSSAAVRAHAQAFFAATAANLTVMSPDRVTALASALAGAKVAPEPAWLDSLTTAVRNDVMSYTLVQLDALTRALAVFQGLVPEHGAGGGVKPRNTAAASRGEEWEHQLPRHRS
ncbi:hypothetical protein VOLCADRAFT_91781 [Volvox carteri f. nagariensis]|uniref:Uncharacterized protein n=1 Tax=Volvox carteri f. nagariensis TaxID=3068 RepID=D8TXY1_VOLCA|nr:uncharacterized protein VOLCADRAFT_91781 [Volvox carteri f. nagariensis]EFJ47722.1 hypothetical protein VOLCADRAFT_91781 [Volvox carteri f. nagariensis]|eukprot:XP_002951193.1 hypothetical protein VOLCADRAFT_91781 [Volvox carteri f. nagariensis]